MNKEYIPFDWNVVKNKDHWLEPCERELLLCTEMARGGQKERFGSGLRPWTACGIFCKMRF